MTAGTGDEYWQKLITSYRTRAAMNRLRRGVRPHSCTDQLTAPTTRSRADRRARLGGPSDAAEDVVGTPSLQCGLIGQLPLEPSTRSRTIAASIVGRT